MRELVELGKNEDGISTIYIKGEITSFNSKQFKTEIMEVIKKISSYEYVIDLNELDYISSAGLRVLLWLTRLNVNKVKVVNVNPEVYEIFYTTGFVNIFDVRRKLREISIEGCEVIGRGANGTVYRLDEDTIVKVYVEGTKDSLIEKEQKIAQQSFLNGIPTAISYDVVKCANMKGIVFEKIKSENLSTLLNDGPEKWDDYLDEYTGLLKTVHSAKIDKTLFPSIKGLYESYCDICKGYYSEEEWVKIKKLLEKLPDGDTMVHGDFHPRNIMVQDDEFLLIDMGDVSYGHPIFDFIAMAVSMPVFARENQEFAAEILGMKGETIVPFWEGFVKRYFHIEDKEELKKTSDLLCDVGRLKRLVLPAVVSGISKEILLPMMEEAKEVFFSKYDELIAYDWEALFG